MKLRNKKTGEIKDVRISRYEDSAPILVSETTPDENGQTQGWPYYSLAELNEDWEDYEEPKEYWTVECGVATEYTEGDEKYDRAIEAVGLKFDTKEECDRAIEKMKAWQRLENKGFRFFGWGGIDITIHTTGLGRYIENGNLPNDILKDLNLLFGGEE